MSWLRSTRLRIFLICWVLYSAHFATNVVREHYPVFAFIEHGHLRLDDYAGLHADIFQHRDGHWYTGNQIAGSLPPLLPMLIFDPLLDAIQSYSEGRLAELRERGEALDASYESEYPNRPAFLRKAKERGLELRFGATTVVTSVFCMAPLAALFVVFLYGILRERGVPRERAVLLALLFAFGTPLFYRTAHLVHNVFLMMTSFGCFWLLWPRPADALPVPPKRVYWAGFLGGWCVALDYAGVIPLLCFYGYLILARTPSAGLWRAFLESLRFVAASLPPVLFLLFTQYWMYGNPFMPGQYWMPDVTFTERGWRGISLPSVEVFLRNLFDPNWGLYPFAPLLLLGLVPARWYPSESLIVPRRERAAQNIFIVVFMLFCAANQYSLMQFNTGFRYLLPLVPFIYLALCDHLVRAPSWALYAVGIPAVIHTWVLCMIRYTQPQLGVGEPAVPESWARFLASGPQLPWLTVLRQTTPDPDHPAHWWIWPSLLIGFCLALCFALWSLGRRAQHRPSQEDHTPSLS
jgi:hypothetical protein